MAVNRWPWGTIKAYSWGHRRALLFGRKVRVGGFVTCCFCPADCGHPEPSTEHYWFRYSWLEKLAGRPVWLYSKQVP